MAEESIQTRPWADSAFSRADIAADRPVNEGVPPPIRYDLYSLAHKVEQGATLDANEQRYLFDLAMANRHPADSTSLYHDDMDWFDRLKVTAHYHRLEHEVGPLRRARNLACRYHMSHVFAHLARAIVALGGDPGNYEVWAREDLSRSPSIEAVAAWEREQAATLARRVALSNAKGK